MTYLKNISIGIVVSLVAIFLTSCNTSGVKMSFVDYMDKMNADVSQTAVPGGFKNILTVKGVRAPCPKPPAEVDGPCGFDLNIFGPTDWEKKEGAQTFYLMEEWQTGTHYFGPFQDDLKRIAEEAKQEEKKVSYQK